MSKKRYYGAAFLMATSAIGPGFLTSTATFTAQLGASFGFAILVSILVDWVAQVNIWRAVTASGQTASALVNAVYPGLGHVLSAMIITGGMVFNIGNIAGCGLGLQVLAGLDVTTGALLSAVLCMLLFWIKEAGGAMDWFAKILGFVMIGLTLYVALVSQPPLPEAILRSLWPERIDPNAILTIVGGTVGGYITFAGAHRLLEAGVVGREQVETASRSATTAIMAASAMRIVLFLAALGVVAKGHVLNAANPAASVFEAAAGSVGRTLFGIVIWAAAVTSVVGASFTSVSFMGSLHPSFAAQKRGLTIGFIGVAALLFAWYGKPVKVLLFAGAFNGIILSVALALVLWASTKKHLMNQYEPPRWLLWAGAVVAALLLLPGCMAVWALLFKG